MNHADDRAHVIPDVWRILLTAALFGGSAGASFVTVRAWRVPVQAEAVASARLTIDTQPAGAELLIDEQRRGTTPQTVAIEPGDHTFVVRAAGVERTVRVTLAPGAHVVHHFELAAKPAAAGRLSIVSEPAGARVTVDGRLRGTSPLVVENVAAGEHVVSVEGETGTAQRKITVANGATSDVLFSLTHSAAAPVAGWMVVSSPFPVDVIERDEVVGSSGASKIMLAAGRHNVVLRNDALGYAAPRNVEVVPGRVARVEVEAPQARVNINARPWADVSIDGVAVGQTPLANLTLPIGSHQITFRHPQLGERTDRFTVAANRENRVAIDLTK
jgi:hypothetical protein